MKCLVCGLVFEKKVSWQKFCSRICSWKYWDKKSYKKKQNYQKTRNLRRRYNMSRKEYDKLYSRQRGKCVLCSCKPMPPYRSLSVDHCHSTNKVRGLLCGYCNRKIIGAIEKIGFEKIAKYLGYKIRSKL